MTDRKKTVLIEHHSLESFNGQAIFQQMFALSLKEYGHDVRMYVRKYNPSVCFDKFNSNIKVIESNIYFHSFQYLKGLIGLIFQIVTAVSLIFSGERAEIFVTDSYFSLWLIKLFTRMKCIMYVHYPETLYIRDQPGSILKSIYTYFLYLFEATSVLTADKVIVNSKWTKKSAQKRLLVYRLKNVGVLYPYFYIPGIAFKDTHVSNQPSIVDSHSEFRFMSINRFCSFKKIEFLIKALAILKERLSVADFNKIKLVLVGGISEQDYLDNLKEMIKTLQLTDNVEFHINVSNNAKTELFKSSNAFVYSSINEHFGIGLCEAQEYSIPVIATRTGGPCEIIEHGVNGYLVDPNEHGFAEYMLKLFTDQNKAIIMGKHGNTMLDSNYGIKIANETFLNLLTDE